MESIIRPPPVSESPGLSQSEVAQYLRISRSLVYQLVESGRLPACRIGCGGAIRIIQVDLLDYVESCRMKTGGAVGRPLRRREKLKHLKV